MSNGSIRALQVGSILFLIAMVVVNFLSTSLPINNVTMADVTYKYPHLLIPAGFTFSIWGVIYLFLAAYCIYQAAGKTMGWVQRIGVLFIITCILNIAWIYSWHHFQIGLCLLIILTYFVVLLMIYRRTSPTHIHSTKEMWLVSIPFSIYMGWLTIASLENFSTWLVSVGLPGIGVEPVSWAAINIVVGTLCAVFFRLHFKDRIYTLVIAWALFGIAYRQYSEGANTIVIVAGMGVLVNVVLSLIPVGKQLDYHRPANAASA